MQKKFKFEISKNAVIALTKRQQKSVRAGDPGTWGCPVSYNCDMDAPTYAEATCDGAGGTALTCGCPASSVCGGPVGTSAAAGCSTTPDTHFGCNTSQSNCYLTKGC